MWKRTENEQNDISSPATPAPARPQPVKEQAIIGPSLVVKGDLSGDEDLVIQGQVEGKVILKNNGVTVGKNGRVKADLYGKTIAVEGTVSGNLYGEDSIVIRASGSVRGNLQAPRVTLEDGSKFKGSIDMEGPEKKQSTSSQPAKPSTAAGSSPGSQTEKGKDSKQGELGIGSKSSSSKT